MARRGAAASVAGQQANPTSLGWVGGCLGALGARVRLYGLIAEGKWGRCRGQRLKRSKPRPSRPLANSLGAAPSDLQSFLDGWRSACTVLRCGLICRCTGHAAEVPPPLAAAAARQQGGMVLCSFNIRPPVPHCAGLKQSALLSLVPSISPSRHQCCLAWPCCRRCAPATCAWAAGSARAALVHGS